MDINWRFISKVNIGENNECWEWKTVTKHKFGYGQMYVNGKTRDAHKLAWELAYGTVPAGLFVCHKCDNPSCCNPAHLFLGTPQDNMTDMKNKGRVKWVAHKGAANGKSKLTEEQVYQIRAAAGTQESIAKQFGISQAQVSNIRLRRYWK